jgi:hypothetical protein
VPAAALDSLMAQARAAGVALTDIGTIRSDKGAVQFLNQAGHPLTFKQSSFSHF